MLGIFSGGGCWVLETLWFESESQLVPEKAIGAKSLIELWSPNLATVLLCWFRN